MEVQRNVPAAATVPIGDRGRGRDWLAPGGARWTGRCSNQRGTPRARSRAAAAAGSAIQYRRLRPIAASSVATAGSPSARATDATTPRQRGQEDRWGNTAARAAARSEEHTSELQ